MSIKAEVVAEVAKLEAAFAKFENVAKLYVHNEYLELKAAFDSHAEVIALHLEDDVKSDEKVVEADATKVEGEAKVVEADTVHEAEAVVADVEKVAENVEVKL